MVTSTGCDHRAAAVATNRLGPASRSSSQSDSLPLSTWLVAPPSTSARPASFRPEIVIAGATTRVLAEQTASVDPERLGERAGHLTTDELQRIDAALRIILEL